MLMRTKRLVASLVLVSGILGARFASAQATPQEQAAQRQAEIEQLRAQQEQIRAQLEVLAVEKQKLVRELEQRKAGADAAQDAAAVYKRAVAQREQALAQAKDAEAAERAAKEQRHDRRFDGHRQEERDQPLPDQLHRYARADSHQRKTRSARSVFQRLGAPTLSLHGRSSASACALSRSQVPSGWRFFATSSTASAMRASGVTPAPRR